MGSLQPISESGHQLMGYHDASRSGRRHGDSTLSEGALKKLIEHLETGDAVFNATNAQAGVVLDNSDDDIGNSTDTAGSFEFPDPAAEEPAPSSTAPGWTCSACTILNRAQ